MNLKYHPAVRLTSRANDGQKYAIYDCGRSAPAVITAGLTLGRAVEMVSLLTDARQNSARYVAMPMAIEPTPLNIKEHGVAYSPGLWKKELV